MTPHEIAQHLKIIKQRELDCTKSSSLSVKNIGNAIVTIDPTTATALYPSTNNNGVFFSGCGTKVSQTDLLNILNMFKESDIERFFFWLSPNPQQEEMTTWLGENGLKPFQGPQYPTLIRPVEEVPPHETHLRVAHASESEIENHIDTITAIFNPWPCAFFFTSSGQPNFDHFLAYEDDTPVSAAILATHDHFAYFGWAATAEAHRGKGGQNALIKARLNRAAELKCQTACSETLSMLKASLNNLKRNGFEIVYEKRVFFWEA